MEDFKRGTDMIWFIYQMDHFDYKVRNNDNEKKVEVFLKRGNMA